MRLATLTAAAVILGSAGAYAEGVSVSGSAKFGVKLDGSKSGSDAFTFHHEFDITFAASGTTDAGMTFGATTTIDNNEGLNATYTGAETTGTVAGTGVVTGTGTVTGNVNAAEVYELIGLVKPSTFGDSGHTPATCWIGGDGRIYSSSDAGEPPVASTGNENAGTDGYQGVADGRGAVIPRFWLNTAARSAGSGYAAQTPDSFRSAEEVFMALGMQLPTGDDMVTRPKKDLTTAQNTAARKTSNIDQVY